MSKYKPLPEHLNDLTITDIKFQGVNRADDEFRTPIVTAFLLLIELGYPGTTRIVDHYPTVLEQELDYPEYEAEPQ